VAAVVGTPATPYPTVSGTVVRPKQVLPEGVLPLSSVFQSQASSYVPSSSRTLQEPLLQTPLKADRSGFEDDTPQATPFTPILLPKDLTSPVERTTLKRRPPQSSQGALAKAGQSAVRKTADLPVVPESRPTSAMSSNMCDAKRLLHDANVVFRTGVLHDVGSPMWEQAQLLLFGPTTQPGGVAEKKDSKPYYPGNWTVTYRDLPDKSSFGLYMNEEGSLFTVTWYDPSP